MNLKPMISKLVTASTGISLLAGVLVLDVQAGVTQLATEPISSSSSVSAKPNIMFVLDDSGSMGWDYLPDWAGPYESIDTNTGITTLVTPAYRFFNNSYNGVAYSPGTRYKPPVMYDNTGARDLTTYPSMTGQSVATGGDASATATARNWRAVKVDGYGIQSTSTIDLEGQAFSYTTVAGEYCNSVQLRNCTASASATGSYTYPARLRWCSTAAYAVDTTANAGTFCQASNIDDTPTNIANGVTPYIYARMPAQSKATITVGAATTVTNITVNGAKIISSGATGATSTDLATDIAAKINACTYAISGTCGIVGFRAVSMLNVVTVTAPMATTATPVVTAGVAMTASAFSSGNVPGASLFTVIQPRRTASIIVDVAGTATGITVGGSQILSAGATGGNAADLATDIAAKINACAIAVTGSCTVAGYSAVSQGNAVTVTAPGSAAAGSPVVTGVAATSSAFSGGVFPYPGSAVKNSNRSDCAGTTCTYEEEMTNYANWYAYYRTRMQMMKTSASIAFSTVDENYRVGYFSINNGAGSQYLNLSAFDGTQKNLWYSKFFNAVPYGSTPLRTGLANSGRLYAGMLGSLNGVTVVDPVQYSCQQNFTILSTDGYWNDSSSPKQINGSDEIGQQDGNLNRPYYDGSTYTKTVSQTLQSFQQKMMNTFFVESRTSQLQTSTSRLSQEITTTTTQPWKLENSQLQTRVKPLEQSVYALESRTYPLLATTKVLHENTFNPQSTTRPLEKSTFMLTETSTPLKKTVTRIVSSTYPLQVGTEQTIATTTPLQRGTQATYATTTPLQRGTQATYATTTPLQRGTQATLATTTPLQRGTEATQAATTPLQRGTQATYATTTPLQRGTQATYATTTPLQRGVQAIYATVSPLQSTTYKLQSLNFKLQKRSQVYNGVTEHWDDGAWADVTSGTCAVVAAQFNAEGTQIAGAVECQYVVVGTTNGLSSCTDVPKSTSSPYSVRNANICSYETTPTVAAVATCNVASRSGGSPYQAEVACGYGASGVAAPAATCTPNNQTGASSMSGDKVVCSVDATVVWSNSATCSPANPNYPAGTPQVSCKYDTTNTSSPVAGTCTANDQTSSLSTLGASISGDKVACSVASTVTWANSATCSPANPNYPAGTPQVSCRYDTDHTSSPVVGACTARDQSAYFSTIGASISGDKVACSLGTQIWADSATCTRGTYNYATGVPRVSCRYDSDHTVTSAPGATCVANDQTSTLGTNGATNSGDKVTCSVVSTVTWANSATCSPANPDYPAGTPQVSCKYDTTNTSSPVAGSCTANDQTSSLSTLGASISGNRVACSVASTVTWANSATCSPANPNYPAGTPQVSCRYDTNQTTASTPGATCVANDQSALMSTIGASISGNQVLCSLAGVNWVDATGTPPTCTPAPQNYATGTPRISCRYRPTEDVSKRLTDQLTCAAYSQPTNAPMSGNQVTCAYQATPYSVTVETNCQWTTSATAATAQVTCAYDTGANTQSGPVGSCSRVDQSTGSSEGTMWSGPAKSCAYRVPTVATNQPNCTHYGSQSSGPNYSYYETCAYGTASVTSASSCNESLPESGPDFIRGATVSCSYPATPTSVSGSVSSCNWVAPSPTWATPVKTCTYDAATTGAVSSCTDITEGSGGTGTYYGPATVCAYSTTPSATNLNASSCSAQRQTASPYTQATAVDCSFKATPTVSTVTSCTKRDEIGPAYTGAKTLCAYNASFGAWSDVTSGSCVAADQSGATGPSYAVWRECRYDPRSDTYAGTCNGVTASSSPNYTVRNPVTCVPGSYVVSSVTPPATTVDTCNAGTVTTGNVNGTPPSTQVDVITACTYAASPTVVDASSCTEHLREGSPPYTTEVTCPYTTGSWVKAATTAACVPVGTQPPPASMVPADFVGGKNVECRITEPAIPGTGTAASPLPDPSCTPGPVYIDGSNVQTNCVYSINTTPTPVDPTTCTPTVGLPSGPSYIKQTCATSTPSTTVMGCTPLGPTSPLWQTVTCVDNGDGPKNTLADVAAYYYGTDLRTDALNNCTGATVPPATAGSVLCTSTDPMNNVRVSANDPNAFQHMVTYTLGLGASGYMKYSDTYSVDTTGDFPTVKGNSPYAPSDGITANPGAGVCSWQTTDLCNWPVPKPNEQTTIDDLWHAAVNGHGAYYSAGDPESLSAGISAALTGVAGAAGTISAPSFSTSNLNRSDNYLFSSSYVTSDWVGDVVRYRVNPYSGRLLPVVDWSAQSKLDAKATRTIYTFDASVATTKLKAFTSANYATNNYFNKPHISTSPTGLTQFLCASSEICLSATDQDTSHAAGANLVEYLRGARTNEGTEIDNTKYYRLRQHLLGDMVNAPTVYVGKPYREYLDPGYATFKANSASRKAVVYAGANDGMLHAFAAKGNSTTEAAIDAYSLAYEAYAGDTDNAAYLTAVNTAAATASAALSSDTSIGQELWAYIPSMALPNLYKLADKKYKDKHRYFLDGPAVTADICVSDCNSASSVWKTILVGGLARGGRGYFALDVTDPDNPKALWEFTDTHLGYSYGNPQVTKLSDGTWVVIVASGYNNIPNDDGSGGDGVGRLYVLNAATGVQVSGLSPISTGYGSTTSPGGLSNINAMVVDPSTDNTVLAVYGGDLGGNLWRFDVNGSVGPSGYEAQLLAVLKDGSGNRQPVTTKPTVSLVKGQKVIFVGTGRFLDTSDVTDTSQQSMYAIKDPWTTGGAASTAIFDNPGDDRVASASNSKGFVKQSLSWHDCPTGTSSSICNSPARVMKVTRNSVNFATDNGWFIDFINDSERLNTNPALGLGMLTMVTNAPSLLACDVGGKSYIYFLDYETGGYIVSATNPGGVGGYQLANSFASAPTIVVRSSPDGGIAAPVVMTVIQDTSKYVGPGSAGNSPSGGSGSGSSGNPCVGPACTTDPPTVTNISPLQRSSWRELIWE